MRFGLGDLRTAARGLRGRSTTTAIAVLTLALGIGANTTVFSVVDAVLFRDIPFPDPDRLVLVWETVPARGESEAFMAFPNFRDYREGARSFEGMAAFFANPNQDVNLTGGAEPERVNVARVTSTYFEVLGIGPEIGRAFTEDEDRVGNHRVAILSHGLWTRQFGADPDLVGRSVQVNGFPYTVIGIMPRTFRPVGSLALGEEVDMWRPLAASDEQRDARGWRDLRVVARLREDANLETATAEVEQISRRIELEDPEHQLGRGVRLVGLHEQSVGRARRSLLFVWGAVAVVLLVASANVATLLLVQAGGRSREIAIRASLGASRGRIARHLLVESLMLAGIGGILGVLISWLGIDLVQWLAGAHTPLLDRATVDGRVLAFTLIVTGATGVAFGLVPALHSSRTDLSSSLRESGSGSVRGGWGAARVFVVSQLALAMVLLVASGLLVRSFATLRSVDPGFDHEGLLTFQIELPMVTRYPSQGERDEFFRELRTRLRQLPGVLEAANTSALPMGDRGGSSTVSIEGRPEPDPTRRPDADIRLASPEYFGTMAIPLLAGRGFEARDDSTSPRVAMISETLRQRFFDGDDPIGIELQPEGWPPARIIGVVGDVRMAGLANDTRPAIYYAADQIRYNFMTVVARTAGSPTDVLPLVREATAAMDPELPLHNVGSVDELLERNVGREAFTSRLVASFALLALVLAAIGTYGVMASAVQARRRELGVRLALGADPWEAFLLITREGATLVLWGLALGLGAAALTSGLLEALLFGTSPVDPLSYVATAGLLAVVGLGTVALTAIRAARTDPVEPLRAD